MKTIFTHLLSTGQKIFLLFFATILSLSLTAQVIRPYNLIYSNSLKGGHTMFGNTSMKIDSSGNALLYRMNDYGSYTNGRTSKYGNDDANMQFVDIDGGASSTTVVPYGTSWTYSDANSQPADWPNVSSLPGGPGTAPLGYGPTGSVNTSLTDRRTYYFTSTVNVNPTDYDDLTFSVNLDDGAVVYVNGTEVGRINMPGGTPTYTTNSSNNTEPETVTSFTVPNTAPFVNGSNIIQVEVHTSANNETGTDDLFFDLQLQGNIHDTTLNSSSADLVLPAGTNTIKYARLYWGARINSGMGINDNIKLRTIQLRKGNSGAYTTGIAPSGQIDKTATVSGTDSVYQSYVDVTSFLQSGGSGTYTVANIAAATGSVGGGGNYAGWSIVVVYENPTATYSSVRIYDGYLQVYSGGSIVTQSITLTGLNAPSTPLLSSDAYMTAMAWEGDANLATSSSNPDGDYMKLNNITVSNAHNPATNFWNGTITKNGTDITTKSPNYINQFGLDLDEMEVGTGYGIAPNATDATVVFGTEADQYFPSVFAFTMKTKEPSIFIDKSVTDALPPLHALSTNEILTYTLSGSNVGVGGAYKCTIVDTIPSNVTYVPGSLEVVSSPGIVTGSKTDSRFDLDEAYIDVVGSKTFVKFFIGTGATNALGGTLQSGESYSVKFKAITPAVASQVTTVVNLVRITGEGISGDPYVDDATAIIGPEGGSLAVKMTSFNVTKENGNAVLRWTTSAENKNDHFEIEQSFDGINFSKVGMVQGNGTSALVNNYQFINVLYNNAVSVIYYRLKIYDKEANISLTKIVALHLNDASAIAKFNVYPNPFVNNIKMEINTDKEESSSVKIINMAGQTIIKRPIDLQTGGNIVVLKDLETLAKGAYTIEIKTQNGTLTKRVIKN